MIGMTSESAGASMQWTNLVLSRISRPVLLRSKGSDRAQMRMSTMSEISGFLIDEPIRVKEELATSLILGWVSDKQLDNYGTI